MALSGQWDGWDLVTQLGQFAAEAPVPELREELGYVFRQIAHDSGRFSIETLKNPIFKRLHLGCGAITPQGWINLDGSWNAWLAKHSTLRKILKILHVAPQTQLNIPWNPNVFFHDVRRPLPFKDGSLEVIYASHLLEHLYLEEARGLLKECFRVLESGGVLRVVVPDLRAIVLEYIGERPFGPLPPEQEAEFSADRLNRRLCLRSPESPEGNVFYRLYTILKDFHSHKWMYDANSMTAYFRWAGFQDVQEMQFHQSRIEGIEEIEQAGRVLQGEGVCIEGIKPG